jgi:hypothetical protein
MTYLRRSIPVLIALIGAISAGYGQLLFNGSYTEDFDTLPITGTGSTNTFSLAGWYSNDTTIVATNGSSGYSGLLSLGSSSSAERALGSGGSDSVDTTYYALRLVNDTGAPIPSVYVSYVGETWRQGSATSNDPYGLEFAFSRDATGVEDGTYFRRTSLDYISSVPLVVGDPATSGMASAINGNADANRTLISAVLTFSGGWQPGQELWLRWSDLNSNGFDASVGIDNLSIVAVPEPQTYGLALLAGIALFLAHRRRTRTSAPFAI